MFKKSPKTKQFNLFSSPSGLMCERESRMYDDESAWHNKFYKQVTSKVDEDIFKPLYTTEREDNRVGRPNASIRILVSMMILKEGCGCSNEQLYEQCRFNLLYRRALGMVTTAEVQTAIPVKQDQWKISVESSNGKRTWRYFTKEQVDKNEVRNKTRYRTKIKHTLQAIARCAWINMRRLFLYDLEMGLQMANKIVQRPNRPTLGLYLGNKRHF